MNARKNDSQSNDGKLSTAKITTFLHEHNESQPEVANSLVSTNSSDDEELCITKSYRPTSPPTFTEEERQKFREGMKDIRTDGNNLRFDERRQMYYYLPEDHPEYKEHPDLEDMEESNNYRSCTLI